MSKGMVDSFWLQGDESYYKNAYDCIKAFSETDFTEDLEASTGRRSSCMAVTTDRPIGPSAHAAKVCRTRAEGHPAPHGSRTRTSSS